MGVVTLGVSLSAMTASGKKRKGEEKFQTFVWSVEGDQSRHTAEIEV